MSIPNPWLSGTTQVQSTTAPVYYNSALTVEGAGPTTNAKLTIYLRVLMLEANLNLAEKRQVPDPANPGKTTTVLFIKVPAPGDKSKTIDVPVMEWPKGVFKTYCEAVKKQAEDFWNNTKLCLIPPKDLRCLYWPAKSPTHQLNIDCHFEAVWANGFADAHVVFWNTCPMVYDPLLLRSSVGPSPVKGQSAGMLDVADLIPVPVLSTTVGAAGPAVQVAAQSTIAHEFGHALGLPHIGVQSRFQPCLQAMATDEGIGAQQCYMGPTVEESLNIMGLGDRVSTRNSLPWLLRAPRHTDSSLADWRVTLPQRPPRRL
jgi:hypothetical protein